MPTLAGVSLIRFRLQAIVLKSCFKLFSPTALETYYWTISPHLHHSPVPSVRLVYLLQPVKVALLGDECGRADVK
eukprot:g43659.t1